MEPTATVAQADVAVRKRAAKACDQCRRRKTKCDGTTNCAACRSINLNCSYGYHMRQARGPAYVAYLEAKVESLEEQIRRMSEVSSPSESPVVSSDDSRTGSMSSQFMGSDRASDPSASSSVNYIQNPARDFVPSQQQTMNLGSRDMHQGVHTSQHQQHQSQSFGGPPASGMQNESFLPSQTTQRHSLNLEGGSLFARRNMYPRSVEFLDTDPELDGA